VLKRKKRIPYDPPGSKHRSRKPQRPRRVDQIFLNRRVLLIKGAVVTGFAALAARLAQMQLVHGETYTEMAEDNVVVWNVRRPTRGLVYDREGRPLAENRRTWEVRIVPTELPDRGTPEWDAVRERLITALRLPDCLIVDANAVPMDAGNTIYTRVAMLLGDTTPEAIQARIDFINRSAKYNYVVLIEPELSSDDAARINSKIAQIPGVEVVNYLDYLVRNFRYQQTAVTVKRDVSRDVALKLEANRIYLPGVELDDSVLTRRYPGGPVMSHILGYVGQIQDADLNDESNIARIDEDGRRYYKTYQPDDYIGQTGIERQLEELLRGQKGGAYYEVDAYGVEIRELSGATPAVQGKNLRLSVDLELQAAINKALSDGIEFSTQDRKVKIPDKPANTRGGAVVMLSPKTGEVFALVSYPNYDNQLFIDGLSTLKAREYGLVPDPELEKRKQEAEERGEQLVIEGVTEPLTDRAYAGGYAPGSTVKLFVALAGLREKVIDANTQFKCTGAIQVPWTWDETKGNIYPCWIYRTGTGHQELSVVDAIEHSCDVFFYNVGTPRQKPEGATDYEHYRDVVDFQTTALGDQHYFNGLGIAKLKKNLTRRFWFGEPTGIDLPGEAFGLVPDPEWRMETFNDGWSSGHTINTSIGQGDFQASPLQLATNTAAIANGGLILKPRLLHSIVDDDGNEVQSFNQQKLRRITIDEDHLGLVLEGMKRVVHSEGGTANSSIDPETGQRISKWTLTNPPGEEEIIIGGKTGTAEVGAVSEDGTYLESHAWFTCFAPFDDPEVVLTVFLERGGEGSTYAVPIADKAMRAYFEMTGRRKRGVMLREDKQPIGERVPAPNLPQQDATSGSQPEE
jgi:penicillin-binding protein 2